MAVFGQDWQADIQKLCDTWWDGDYPKICAANKHPMWVRSCPGIFFPLEVLMLLKLKVLRAYLLLQRLNNAFIFQLDMGHV